MAQQTVRQWRIDNDFGSTPEFKQYVRGLTGKELIPALCNEGCQVGPLLKCEHGNPSLLIGMMEKL